MSVQDTGTALAELLARATEAEQIELKDGSMPSTLTPDAVQDLAQQALGPEVEDLAEQVAALTEALHQMTDSSAPGVDPVADAEAADDEPKALAWDDEEATSPAGMDYDEPDEAPAEAKAAGYAPCPDCGSRGVDEFADGSPARCEDCGTVVTKAEKKDFDELEDELDGVLEVIEPAVEAKSDTVTLSELELLQARREALEQ